MPDYHVTTTLSKEEVQRIFDLAIERMNYLGTKLSRSGNYQNCCQAKFKPHLKEAQLLESELVVEKTTMRNWKLAKVTILLVALSILLLAAVCYALLQCVPVGS